MAERLTVCGEQRQASEKARMSVSLAHEGRRRTFSPAKQTPATPARVQESCLSRDIIAFSYTHPRSQPLVANRRLYPTRVADCLSPEEPMTMAGDRDTALHSHSRACLSRL